MPERVLATFATVHSRALKQPIPGAVPLTLMLLESKTKDLPADELKKKRLLPLALEVGGVEEVAAVVVVVTLHATTANFIHLTHKTLNAPKH